MSFKRILAGLVLAGLSQLVMVGTAVADLTKGPYVALEGGMAWTANLTYTTGYTSGGGCTIYYCYPGYYNYYNAVTYDLGYSAGAQIGYSFGGPRVEFEYNYRNNGASTIATTVGTQSANGDLTSNNYMINILYDFDTGSKWTPYIGFGLGVADVSANNITTSANIPLTSYLDGSSSKFAAQFILGVDFAVSEKIGIMLDWRGLWASNTNFNYGIGCNPGTRNCLQTGTTNYDYWNGALNVGVRIKF